MQYQTILNSASGELTGVGVELIALENGDIKVDNVQASSPAQEVGLQKGDIIVDVDGTRTAGLAPEDVAALLRYVRQNTHNDHINHHGVCGAGERRERKPRFGYPAAVRRRTSWLYGAPSGTTE